MKQQRNAPRADQGEYHIVARNGQFKVFDKRGHFRIGYPTRQQAEQYIRERSAHHATHANA